MHRYPFRQGLYRKGVVAVSPGTGYEDDWISFYIRKDGFIHTTRPLEMPGAHALGYNQESIGIAYEGGLNTRGQPADTRTKQQKHSMRALIRTLKLDFPIERVCGHRDLSPDRNGNGVVEPHEWMKQCPCFDVATDKWCR